MLEIIVILAVSMILLPFVAILCDKDQQTQARRGISVVILGITLVWLIYVLFFAGVVVSSPHTWTHPL